MSAAEIGEATVGALSEGDKYRLTLWKWHYMLSDDFEPHQVQTFIFLRWLYVVRGALRD